MVHGLFESSMTLLEHLGVDVHDLHASFSVCILLPRVVQNSEGNISSSTSNIHAPHRAFLSRLQGRNKRIFPESMNTKRGSVVHQVVRRRDRIKDILDEVFLGLFRYGFEAKRSGSGRVRIRRGWGYILSIYASNYRDSEPRPGQRQSQTTRGGLHFGGTTTRCDRERRGKFQI